MEICREFNLVSFCFSPGVGAEGVGTAVGGEAGEGVTVEAGDGTWSLPGRRHTGNEKSSQRTGATVRLEFKRSNRGYSLVHMYGFRVVIPSRERKTQRDIQTISAADRSTIACFRRSRWMRPPRLPTVQAGPKRFDNVLAAPSLQPTTLSRRADWWGTAHRN